MSIQIFRGGMQNDVEPRFDWPLDPWSRKRVVANRNQFPLACDFRDRLQIYQFEQWIIWSLDQNHARGRFDRALQIFWIAQIDIGKIKIRRAFPDPIDHPKGAAVQVVARNDMRSA